jgi:hypothetical protein
MRITVTSDNWRSVREMARPRPPCAHEGDVLSWCPAGDEAKHVRRCLNDASEFETCSRAGECARCPHHEAKVVDHPKDRPAIALPADERPKQAGSSTASTRMSTPGRRHLLYHLLPVAGNGVWQRNLDQLRWRMPLFNGRKVIAVCTSRRFRDSRTGRGTFDLDPPTAVAEYLAGVPGVEYVEVANDPHRRELTSWKALWGRLAGADGDDAIFYAQGKGVTHKPGPGVTVHPWARVLYSSLLDFWPVVAARLATHPVAGSFKKVARGFSGSRSAWHYSGSFFWIRAREAYRRDRWRVIDARQWWGNEAWVGLHFAPREGGVVFKAGSAKLDLYRPDVMARVAAEFRAWCGANAGRRAP